MLYHHGIIPTKNVGLHWRAPFPSMPTQDFTPTTDCPLTLWASFSLVRLLSSNSGGGRLLLLAVLAFLLLLVILLLLHGCFGDKLLKDEIVALFFRRTLSLYSALVMK
jgi:hypothetical protein